MKSMPNYLADSFFYKITYKLFNQFTTLLLFSLVVNVMLNASVQAYYGSSLVDVSVILDHGYILDKFPVETERNIEKAYIKAEKGMNYGIRLKNNTNKRIGVVVTVDGRNIISGKKSYLSNKERMYLLKPYQTQTFHGWRTGKNQVNRFYFTKTQNSYASSWGDHSAMGVIAVAAFKERQYQQHYKKQKNNELSKRSQKNEAGTGFGNESYSPSTTVYFKPQKKVSYKSFLKYEWKKTLCKKGIIDCYQHNNYSQNNNHHQRNRFWNDAQYAAYPNGRKKYLRYE